MSRLTFLNHGCTYSYGTQLHIFSLTSSPLIGDVRSAVDVNS